MPPLAALPRADIATVVIRGAYAPVDMGWLPTEPVLRRDIALNTPGVDVGLALLLNRFFGFATFREGQSNAIKAALAGIDSCVLLPTGAGKSLTIKIAGYCGPG